MREPEDEFVVVFCTAGPGEAEPLARALVEERLAACVNISPVRSCNSCAIPEIIALLVIEGHQPYLDWIAQFVG